MHTKIKFVFRPILYLQISTIIFATLRTGFSLYLIYLIQKLLDMIISNDISQIYHLLYRIAMFTGGYLILIFLTQFSLRQLFFTGHFRIMNALYENILKQSLSFFNQHDKGNLLSKITNETQFISAWYAQGIVIFIIQSILLVTTLAVLASYHFIITMLIVGLIAICFITIKWLGKKISTFYDKDQKMNADINQSILQSFLGIFDIKQLHQENYFDSRVEQLLLNQRLKLNQRLALVFASFVGTSAFIAFIIPIVSVVLSAYFVLQHQLSIGSIMAIFSLTKMLDEPIRTISEQVNKRQVAHKTMTKLKDIFDDTDTMLTHHISKLEEMAVNIVDYQNLNVTFKIKPSDIIVIKGRSGIGKTTIANLIQQIIQNQYVKWNNINLSKVPQHQIFNHIMRVNQQSFIFKGTLQENIIFDDTANALLDEIIELCCITHLKDKVIEEQGNNLSGGEKQRINIARVLIKVPDLLILDEVTSALNPELSDKLAQNIIQFAKKQNIALLVISHKNEFDNYASQIIDL